MQGNDSLEEMQRTRAVNEWWACLHTAYKEKVAERFGAKTPRYPFCTGWWLNHDLEKREAIKECVNGKALEG